MDDNIPIDIQYAKLTDWLLDRKWIKLDFRDQADEIRQLITEAIQDMPDVDEITSMLQGTYITYYHCKRIVDLLKVSEADTRSFFGSYSSQRMKDWVEIIKRYETDNVYLGECARILQQNVTYEVPSLKRKIISCQTKIKDCSRREGELKTNSVLMREQFEKTCKDMGITGKNITPELLKLRAKLPAALEKAATSMQSDEFRLALVYYKAFVKFTLDNQSGEADEQLKMISFVNEHGNSTLHHFQTGSALPPPTTLPPTTTPPPPPATTPSTEAGIETTTSNDYDEIDWGNDAVIVTKDGGTIENSAGIDFGGIDFGDDEDKVVSDEIDFGGIDFGDDDDTATADDGGIDFGDAGISIEDNGAEIDIVEVNEIDETTTSLTSSSTSSALATATDVPLLVNPQTRNTIIDQLLQLEGFLMQRQDELSSDIDITSINQFDGAPLAVTPSSSAVASMIEAIAEVRALLLNPQVQQLILITSSPKYVDRLSASLEQKKKTSSLLLKKMDVMRENQVHAQNDIEQTRPKIASLIKQTKSLQKEVQGSISKLYKHRQVNVIGDINTM